MKSIELSRSQWPSLPALAKVFAALVAILHASGAVAAPQTITPGTVWYDTSSSVIQAHGQGMLQVGSTYYWIGEDKTNGSPFQNVKCYSSTDLAHWTFRQNLLTRQSSGDLGPNRVVERPKMIYNDSTKQYVMYMHIDSSDYADARAGVAVSSSAGPCDGPFTYQGSSRPLGNMSRDMTLYKDTDGKAYLISSANNNADLVIYALSADYLSVSQEIYRLKGQSREAPAIFKANGVYFLITSAATGWAPNQNTYMTATSLAGPWSGQTVLTPSSTTTYDSQSAYVLPVTTSSGGTTYVFMGDRWKSNNLTDSRYIWLPLTVNTSARTLGMTWADSWTIDVGTTCAVVPAAPTGLTASAVSARQVTLAWSAVSPPTGCSVTYSVSRNGSQVASGLTTPSYSSTGLTPSTAYQFSVLAVDAAGSSASSATVSATTQAGVPGTFINAGGSDAGDFVADAYFSGGSTYSTTNAIDTSLITGTAPEQQVFQTERYGAFTYTIPGLQAGGPYTATLYFAESYLTAAGQRTFDVAINGTKVLTAFDIFAAAGGANKAVAQSLDTTPDASGQVAIQFIAGVENPKVCGIAVVPISTPTCSAAPSAPAGLTATASSSSQIRLAWNTVSPPANCSVTYSVFRGSTLVATGLTASSFTDTGLTPSTVYNYNVKAVDSAGSSASSSTATATTLTAQDTQAPSAPSGLSASNVTSSSVALSWNPSTDNVGVYAYDIYLGSGRVGSSSTTSATVSSLSPGTTYAFTVKARDAAGNASQSSGSLSVTTIPATDVTPPSAPANLAWASDSGTVTLTWTASTDDVGVLAYELFYGNFSLGSFYETVLTLIGFKPATPYTFTVKAHDAAGNLSVASNQITVLLAAIQDTTPPTAPTNVTATVVTSSSVRLTWTASTDDVGVVVYQVFANGNLATTVTTTSATVSGLSPSGSNSLTVKALDAAGNASASSTPVTVTLLN